jgi:outer membrane protein assembly factor BamB
MGKLQTESSSGAVILPGAVIGGMFNFALWNQSSETYIYVQGEQDVVKSYRITAGAFQETPASAGTVQVQSPRVGMTLSANGVRNGILWETTGDSNPGTLHAFDASNLANELWNSDMTPGDTLGKFIKFTNPTVANGKVYVATDSGSVVVYGITCPNTNSRLPGCTSY